jgi:hypothetical protein
MSPTRITAKVSSQPAVITELIAQAARRSPAAV